MNWSLQISLAFQLLNNAALLVVGTVAFCGFRRHIRDRLPDWAQSLICGSWFGLLGILVSSAPAISAFGYPITLRVVVLIVVPVYYGMAAGAAAALVQVSYIALVQLLTPGMVLPMAMVVSFALPAAYKAIFLAGGRPIQLGELGLLALGVVVALFEMAALMLGVPLWAAILEVGPVAAAMTVLSTVSLGAIIRYMDRAQLLAATVRDSERRFRSFYNETPVMLTAIDHNGQVAAASDRWLEFMGYERHEVVGKSRYKFLTATSAALLRDTVLPSLRRGVSSPEVDLQLTRKDGSMVDVAVTFALRRDPLTDAEQVLGFTVDRSAQKRAERALVQRESDLRAIVDHAPVAIFLKDRDGRYRLVNRRFEEWSGQAASEIVGRTDVEILPPPMAPVIQASDRRVLDQGQVHQTERQPSRRESPDQQILVTKFPIRDERQEIVGIAGFAVDITERKRAETALRDRDRDLRAIMDHAPFAIFLKDTQRRYQLVNRCYTEWFGPRADEILGRSAEEIHPEAVWDESSRADAEVLQQGRVAVVERERRSKRTAIGYLQITQFPIRDERGEITGIAGFCADITEHKQAETALRESRELLIESQRLGRIGHLLSDRRTNRVYWSETLFELRGVPKREFFTFDETLTTPAIHPDDKPKFDHARDAGIADREDFAIDIRVQRPDGSFAWEYVVGHPRYADDGGLASILYVLQDITDRKLADEALKRKEAELRAIMDNAPFAIFLKDRDMRYQLINRTYTDWFGDRAEDLIGRRAAEVYPSELVRKWEEIDREILNTGEISHDERRVQTAKPGLEYTLTTKFPIRGADGSMIGFAGIIADITDRKRAEQALQQSEARFRALIEHSNDMVDVVTADGQVTYRSPANAEVLGYADPEVVGRSIAERVHPDDAAEILGALRSLAQGLNIRAAGRSRVRHSSGAWRTVAWSARDARDVPGINGIIVNSRDVTEAQQLEEQLQHSQKMDAVGHLAGGVAHDFNNILGAILGFGGFLLQDLSPDAPEHGFAQRIVTAAERGKELVQQILAFSRRSTVERRPSDLGSLVREARELLRASIPTSTRLEMRIFGTPLVAEVNPAQVTQILMNLCLNANDALEGEPGHITVNLSPAGPIEPVRVEALLSGRVVVGALKPEHDYARIAVADSGVGMSHDVMRHIFDPFFTTKRRGQGTGLGLSVVHGIVMAYDGALVVASEPGNGSVFEVYLPLSDAPAQVSGSTPSVSAVRGQERVLVVDDELMMTDVLTTGLDRLGYDSVGINDALRVTALFVEDPESWDVVISDQVMPGIKGLALCKILKKLRPSLRFILCTGFSEGLTEEEALSAGADAFFLKPVRPEALAAAIRQFFDRDAAAAN
jgi:PAS domain S-box-containing protein